MTSPALSSIQPSILVVRLSPVEYESAPAATLRHRRPRDVSEQDPARTLPSRHCSQAFASSCGSVGNGGLILASRPNGAGWTWIVEPATSSGVSARPTWTTCRRAVGQAIASPRANTRDPAEHQTSSGSTPTAFAASAIATTASRISTPNRTSAAPAREQ
jgi:hypothetical protein